MERSSDAGGLHHEARARIVGLMRLADASRGSDNLLTLQLWEQGGSNEGAAAPTSGTLQLTKAPHDEVSLTTAWKGRGGRWCLFLNWRSPTP